jgi:PAS domain S-box-containing protein
VLDITDRQCVEEELRLSQERLQQALRASGTGLWNWNTKTNAVVFSEEWKRQLGYSGRELVDAFETWTTFLHPDDREGAIAYARQYQAAPDGDYRQEFRLRHKDGTYRWIEARASFVAEPDGRRIRLLGSHTDITDRKLMEESIRESEERYRTLVELSPSGVFVFCEGRTVYVNRTGTILMGARETQEILDRPTFDFIHPDYHQEVRENVKRLLSGGVSVHSAERVYVRLDGTTIPVQVEAGRITWDGKPAILGIFSDITERKQAEDALANLNATLERQVSDRTEALRRSEERFRQFFDHAPNVKALKDHNGRYLYANRRFDEVFELAPGAALGRTDEELFSQEQAAQFRANDRKVLASGRGQEFEEVTQQRDGLRVSIVVKFPVADAAGHLSAIGVIATDVTERNRTQEALRESEDRWQQFAESVRSAFWIADVGQDERQVLYVNSAFTFIWGIEREEIYQNWSLWIESIHPDDRMRVKTSHDRFVSGGMTAVFHCEYRIVGRDGHIRWISDRRVRMAGRENRIAGIAEDITHHKQQLALMAQTEAIGKIGGWQFDFLTDRLWWSDETYHLHETTPEIFNPTVEASLNFYTPESRPIMAEAWLNGVTQGQPWDLELELISVKGRRIAVRATGQVDVLEGRAVRAYGTFQDITERKLTEEALQRAHDELERKVLERTAQLQASEERYARATAVGKVGVWELDVLKGLYHGDANLKMLFGYGPEELSTDPFSWLKLVHPDDQSIAMKSWEQVQSGAIDECHYELRVVRRDGAIIWTDVRGHGVRDSKGQLTHLIGATVDITERKQAEQALRESEERFSKAFRTSPHPIGITEVVTGRCVEVNDASLEAFGFRREEVIGNTTFLLGIWPNLEDRARVIERLKAGQPMRNMEFALRTKSGAFRHFLASADLAELNGVLCVVTVANDITDRKQAEEALRISEERFAKAFQASPHPVVISELDSGLIIDANEAAWQLFGYHKEESTGHTTFEIGLWHSVEERARYFELLKQQGSIRNMEVQLRSKNGDIRHCLLSSELIELNGKQCAVTVGDDITESRRLEKALRLTQFSVDQAVEAIIWLDPNAWVFNVNDTACRMLEYSRGELLGMTVHDIDPNFPLERWIDHWNYLKERGSLTFEARFWSRTGAVLETDVSVNYLLHEGNEYACMILRDIGDRKRAEADLHRSHMFLRQVIDTDPNFIFAKDRDGRYTMANKAVADCYGTTVDDLIGKSDADFNSNADEVEFFRKKDREVMHSLEDRFIPEEQITDALGKTRWLQTVKRPIYDDDGRAHMVLGASTDITERKRMEEILRHRERDLSAAIQERERISQDLHDGILQSLYAVGLGLEGCKPLIRKQSGPLTRKFMKTLDQSIGQLNQVMGEVRNFIAGLESHVIQGGDFPTALRNLVETISSSASIKCRARIDEAAARQLSTEQALHIINIVREGVSNALRHSGATRITVSLRDLTRSVRLTITDNGVGFNTSSAQGVGHGLTNMAARAQKVRGAFLLRSTPCHGTKISLDLPKETTYAYN